MGPSDRSVIIMCLQLQPLPQIPSSDSSDKQRNLNSELNQDMRVG